MACNGEIVVAMDRMNRVLDFDPIDRRITVQAGTVTRALGDFAAQRGLFYPVDFASAASSQIGGNIATNAGGIRVIRYGMTRDWVRGLKVVTGAGELLDLNHGLIKNNTGYDFRHLFIGSEGTLGIICEATLGLTQPPAESAVMLLAVTRFVALLDVLKEFRDGLQLSAFEFFAHNGLEKVLARQRLPQPMESQAPFYALLEFEKRTGGEIETAMACFERCMQRGLVTDGVVSQSVAQARSLWRLREDLSETLSDWKPYKNDISVSVSQMPEFIRRVDLLTQSAFRDFEVVWYGHIGDGNLHLNVLKPETLDVASFAQRCQEISPRVAELIRKFNGSISAEHGIGLLKKDYLPYSRSDAEINAMRELKKIFDPNGIMNPGKIFRDVSGE